MNALPAPQRTDSPDDFSVLRATLLKLTGLELNEYKRQQMERRLRTFALRKGCNDLASYAKLLERDKAELFDVLQRITINVSQLFRNPEIWDRLRDHVLPELAKRGAINAWSAGCSYGAEAHSLSALFSEHTPGVATRIYGSDIDELALKRCEKGAFTIEDARSAPPLMMRKYFTKTADGWQAKDEIRERITVKRENLLTVSHPQEFDLVLCRNVVIYFTEEARNRIHAMLAASLKRGGFLVIGSSERITQPLEPLGLEARFPLIYQKV